MSSTRTLVIAGLALGLLAGCGDDEDEQSGLSKTEYIAKANASCARHERAAGAAFDRIVGGGRTTAAESQRFLSEAVVPALRDGTAERADLPAPEGDGNEIDAINAAARRAVAEFSRIASDRSRSAALMRGAEPDPAKKVDALNRRYGIDKCGGGE